ncbi:DUF6461 domain-containing protein [Streptosporangium sp. NBC_01756]|uniref:DUF6461 domain-containing protein n=1 Tax=Streptosporangium sp. NBC_01756 TaxID=2975950 RepID=UPI002DDA38BF|nr:DUF6461 domain-containing protein [Streptosporangium sp. NBC_01756]WSC85641.1 DUF6461 domain-containing protein [Streptosporangium sp. NBC_01756]
MSHASGSLLRNWKRMNISDEGWELLRAYGMDDIFVSAWCKGLSVQGAASRLRADQRSAALCTWENIEDDLDPTLPREGVVWIGSQAPGWVQIIQFEGDHLALPAPQQALTADGGELLYLGWPLRELEGPEDLEYVVDGRSTTSVCLVEPSVRAGRDPDALKAHMEGLSLGIDNDPDAISDAAFSLVGRVTGRLMDADWLQAAHTRYIIPIGAWDM